MTERETPELKVDLGDPIQEPLLRRALTIPEVVPHLTRDAVYTYAKSLQDLGCPRDDAEKSARALGHQEPEFQVALAYTARKAASNHNGNGVSSKRHVK